MLTQVYFKEDGNVGIGTTAPNAKLLLSNNVAAGALDICRISQLLYDSGANTSYGFIRGGTMVFNLIAPEFDEGSTKVTIAAGGNVASTTGQEQTRHTPFCW
jgi:hypothetical protein